MENPVLKDYINIRALNKTSQVIGLFEILDFFLRRDRHSDQLSCNYWHLCRQNPLTRFLAKNVTDRRTDPLIESHPSSFHFSNLPVGQICLVCHQDHGKFVSVFDPQYLFMKFENFVEWGFVGDGVDEEEPFTGPHVLFTHSREFFLTSRVQD